MENIKLVIACDDIKTGNRFAKVFQRMSNINIVGIADNGIDAFQKIQDTNPDVLLTDAFLSQIDALEIIERINELGLKTKTLVLSSSNQDKLVKRFLDAGVEYFMIKPFDIQLIAKRIIEAANAKPNTETFSNYSESMSISTDSDDNVFSPALSTLDKASAISKVLSKLGVPTHIKGWDYLSTGISLSLDNPSLLDKVTKALYPEIAATHNATVARVERAIRHAIEVTWQANQPVLQKYICSGGASKKPSNSEFIAKIVRELQLLEPKEN